MSKLLAGLLVVLLVGACGRTARPVEAPRASDAAAPVDLPRWSDLLAPRDAKSGAPVADVTVVVVARDGARTEHTLADFVSPEQLEDGVLAILDGSQHLARFLRPSELRGHRGPPRGVKLAPAGRIEIRSADGLAETLPPIELRLRPDYAYVFDEFDGAEVRELLDPRTGADRRARLVHELFGNARGEELIALDQRPHPFSVIDEQMLIVRELPFVFEEVALGVYYDVQIAAQRRFAVTPDEFFGTDRVQRGLVEIARHAPTMIAVVHALGRSSVRARAPVGASDVRGVLTNGDSTFERDGGEGVELVFDDVVPLASELFAQWTNADGSHAIVRESFEVADGEVKDLGELAPASELALTVVPRVFVDGREDAALLAALADDCVWTARIEFGASLVFERDFVLLEPFVLHAPAAPRTRCRVESVELPDVSRGTLKSRYRWRDVAKAPIQRNLEGAREVHIDLHFDSLRHIDVRFSVPPSPDGTPRRVLGHVVHERTHETVPLSFDVPHDPDPSAPWTLVGTAHVPRTSGWLLEVVATPRIAARDFADESRAFPPAWFVRAPLAADVVELAPTLELAATAVRVERDDLLTLPVYRAVDDAGETSLVRPQRFGDRIVWFGLRPGVLYHHEIETINFVAPEAGTVLRLP
jgi:hypothetical protein